MRRRKIKSEGDQPEAEFESSVSADVEMPGPKSEGGEADDGGDSTPRSTNFTMGEFQEGVDESAPSQNIPIASPHVPPSENFSTGGFEYPVPMRRRKIKSEGDQPEAELESSVSADAEMPRRKSEGGEADDGGDSTPRSTNFTMGEFQAGVDESAPSQNIPISSPHAPPSENFSRGGFEYFGGPSNHCAAAFQAHCGEAGTQNTPSPPLSIFRWVEHEVWRLGHFERVWIHPRPLEIPAAGNWSTALQQPEGEEGRGEGRGGKAKRRGRTGGKKRRERDEKRMRDRREGRGYSGWGR